MSNRVLYGIFYGSNVNSVFFLQVWILSIKSQQVKLLKPKFFSLYLQMGLWQRLGVCVVGDRKIHVRILLAEHCELLQFASNLKSLHQEHQALVDDSIRSVFNVMYNCIQNPLTIIPSVNYIYKKVYVENSLFWILFL